MKLFTGPGLYLVVPYGWTEYPEDDCPICKENIKKRVNRYTGSNDPRILALPHGYFKRLKVPFGTWWVPGKTPKIIRPWTYEEANEWLKNNDR